jgi:signal transduction histidine kinase
MAEIQGKHHFDLGKYAITGLFALTLAIPLIGQPLSGLDIFDFQFNIYGVLSMVSAAITLVLLFYTSFRIKTHSDDTVWLMLLLIAISIFGVAEGLQRMSITAPTAVFWATLSSIGGATVPVFSFLFTLSYTRPHSRHGNAVVAMLTAALFMLFFEASGNALFDNNPAHAHMYPWGWNTGVGPVFLVISIWVFVPVMWALLQIIRFRRTTDNPALSAQARLITVGFAIPLAIGLITDIGFPVAGKVNYVPPLATTSFTLTAVLLVIATTRYKLFRLSPALLANNILSTMRDMVVVTNPQLHIEFMNTEAETLFAKKPNYASTPLPNFFEHAGSPESAFSLHEISSATAAVTITKLSTKIGEKQRYFNASVSRIVNGTTIEGYVWAFSDVTALQVAQEQLQKEKESVEQKVKDRTLELFQERARLEASINSLRAGFFMTDPSGDLLTINPSAKSILFVPYEPGQSPGEADVLAHVPDSPTMQDIDRALGGIHILKLIKESSRAKKTVILDEVEHQGKVLQIFLAPIAPILGRDEDKDTVLGSVVLIEDITEAKVLERSKDEFFSIASHELRTPLTAIRGYSSMINQMFEDELNKSPDLSEMITNIHNSSIYLIGIVNDFLDMSRLEQNQLQLNYSSFAINDVISKILAEMDANIKEKKIKIKLDDSIQNAPALIADADRVKQVLYNLIGNSVKFTQNGTVTLEAVKKKDKLEIRVADTGTGVPADNIKLLFHKFQQAGNSLLTRDTAKGTGLGLYISKMLANKMDGDLVLEKTEVNKGSVFVFTIPIRPSPEKTAAVEAKSTIEPTKA